MYNLRIKTGARLGLVAGDLLLMLLDNADMPTLCSHLQTNSYTIHKYHQDLLALLRMVPTEWLNRGINVCKWAFKGNPLLLDAVTTNMAHLQTPT